MDVRGVGQASAGYTWAPDTLQEAVRTALDDLVQAKLEQIQELPVELLSDERLGRELESLGVSTTPDRLVAARALIQEQGQLDPNALNELERSLNTLGDHSEPEARAAAFLQARQLPVTKETIALVLNRTQDADLAGTRMATLIDQVAKTLGAKAQAPATSQPPQQAPQPPAHPPTPPTASSAATPAGPATTTAAPTPSQAPQAPQAPTTSEVSQAPQEPSVQSPQAQVPTSADVPRTPAPSAPAAPPPAAAASEPQDPAVVAETPPPPPAPKSAPTAAAQTPPLTANQTQAQAVVKPATPMPTAPQPPAATVIAAKTEAPVLDRLVAPPPVTVPSPPTTRQELGERLRSFTLPEGQSASAVVAGLKRLVQALQSPESDLSRAIATQDPQAPLDAKSRLSHLATEAVRQTSGDPAAKQLEGEVRFTQLQNATSPTPDERVITIPVWWASGSGEIRVHDQSQGGEKRPGETNKATRVVIDLRTPHLQTVRIDLLLSRGQVNCQVAVQDQGVATFLQPHLVDLRSGLEKAGVRVNSLGVRTMAADEVDPLDAKGVDFYG